MISNSRTFVSATLDFSTSRFVRLLSNTRTCFRIFEIESQQLFEFGRRM